MRSTLNCSGVSLDCHSFSFSACSGVKAAHHAASPLAAVLLDAALEQLAQDDLSFCNCFGLDGARNTSSDAERTPPLRAPLPSSDSSGTAARLRRTRGLVVGTGVPGRSPLRISSAPHARSWRAPNSARPSAAGRECRGNLPAAGLRRGPLSGRPSTSATAGNREMQRRISGLLPGTGVPGQGPVAPGTRGARSAAMARAEEPRSKGSRE
mmetsp:Transcript_489/g.1641  ORF Transcript_489/g.1641 Transcript_489/m.1641 type:complete len:210 (-) Transcript_489:9-638(-)